MPSTGEEPLWGYSAPGLLTRGQSSQSSQSSGALVPECGSKQSGLIVSPVAEDMLKIRLEPLKWPSPLRAGHLSRASTTNHPHPGTYGEECPKNAAGCSIEEYKRETRCI